MTSWMYAGLFTIFMFAWPLALHDAIGQPAVAILLIANAVLAGTVWCQCSSYELSFFAGLALISDTMLSGCAGITILYLPILLIVVYLIAIYHSMIGVACGRAFLKGDGKAWSIDSRLVGSVPR